MSNVTHSLLSKLIPDDDDDIFHSPERQQAQDKHTRNQASNKAQTEALKSLKGTPPMALQFASAHLKRNQLAQTPRGMVLTEQAQQESQPTTNLERLGSIQATFMNMGGTQEQWTALLELHKNESLKTDTKSLLSSKPS